MNKLALFVVAGALSLSASSAHQITSGRIFKGDDAKPNQFPSQVKLFVQKASKLELCSGTLISGE
jgi:secreted trypsin-like serine protease